MTRSKLKAAALSLGVVALFVGGPFASAAAPVASSSATQSPFYCDRGSLTPAERARHFDVLGPSLAGRRQAVHELPDGYEFQFASDSQTFQDLAEWVEGERRCCPFFDITLRIMPEHGRLSLRLTGRPGTKQFIEADGGAWLKPVS